MTRCVLAIALAALTGCSSLIGLNKEPSLQEQPSDAAIDVPIDMNPAACRETNCPFGCDQNTNACRDGKLWIFKTPGAFLGNAFGGADNPPNVRAGADGKCLAAYAAFTSRQCNTNRLHAVLHISGNDSIELMATRYGIPTNVPVNRAEDDVLVSNNWNDLTDPAKPLRQPATTAASDTAGQVWTGNNAQQASCTNWTSAGTDVGTRGYTNRTDATWLATDTLACNRGAGLLCICWSGGQ